MTRLKKYNTIQEWESSNSKYPSVGLIGDNIVYQTPQVLAGDVTYWDGYKVKTTSLSKWDTSLGTAIGVVVVPKGFAPDGKARIIGLKPVDKDGNQSDSHVGIAWGPAGVDTSLTNYTRVPTTDNAGSTSTGSSYYGYLPSDKFTGTQSFVDSKVKYNKTANLIPSPYLGDSPNTEYYNTLSGNNALGDFNGLSNTEILVGLGSDYEAANAAWKYKDGASNLQWYLPGMGELGYIMPRFNEINNTITTLGGLAVSSSLTFWSSSEHSRSISYAMDTYYGAVDTSYDINSNYVRPFAII